MYVLTIRTYTITRKGQWFGLLDERLLEGRRAADSQRLVLQPAPARVTDWGTNREATYLRGLLGFSRRGNVHYWRAPSRAGGR